MPCLLHGDKWKRKWMTVVPTYHRRCPSPDSSTLLVRRWVHKLAYMNRRQRVETADREALRFDLNRSAIDAELPMF